MAEIAEERPSSLWFNGTVIPWADGTVHVWSELAIRGASVFEGIRAYWHDDERRHYVLALEDHMKRLYQSAKLLRLPAAVTEDQLVGGLYELLSALDLKTHAYVRPTLYIDSGRYGTAAEVTTGSYIVAFPVPRPSQTMTGARCMVSSWRRAHDLTLPPRAKAGAAYQAFRLPLIEARHRGFDDVILLNERGTVAETSGASIFIVRDGDVITPSVTSGILESITRKKVIELLATEFGVPVTQREVDRSELYIADEIFLTGTLCEIQPVIAVDEIIIGEGAPGAMTVAWRDRYFEVAESGADAPPGWLTPCGVSS